MEVMDGDEVLFKKSHPFYLRRWFQSHFLGGKIMRKTIILLLFLSVTSHALGGVSARVCLSDGITPLELADPCIPDVYRDVMVGTKLTVIIASDTAEYWYGGALGVLEENMLDIGRLYGRC